VPLAGLLAASCSAFEPVRAQRLGLVLTPVLVLARELGPACAASNTPAVSLGDLFHQLLDFDPELELELEPLCKTQPRLLVLHSVGVAQSPSFVGVVDGVVVPGFEAAAEVGLEEAGLRAVDGGVGS